MQEQHDEAIVHLHVAVPAIVDDDVKAPARVPDPMVERLGVGLVTNQGLHKAVRRAEADAGPPRAWVCMVRCWCNQEEQGADKKHASCCSPARERRGTEKEGTP